MNHFNSAELLTAEQLFQKTGMGILWDKWFVSAHLSNDLDYSLMNADIQPIAKDTRNSCELYSGSELPKVIDIFGPIYLRYLQDRYGHVNDLLVVRAKIIDEKTREN